MVNHLALKASIRQSGFKLYKLANVLGITRQALAKKLDGETQFTVAEATTLIRELKIPREEIVNYFFI